MFLQKGATLLVAGILQKHKEQSITPFFTTYRVTQYNARNNDLFKALVWVLDKAREVYGVRLTFLVIEVRKQSSNAV